MPVVLLLFSLLSEFTLGMEVGDKEWLQKKEKCLSGDMKYCEELSALNNTDKRIELENSIKRSAPLCESTGGKHCLTLASGYKRLRRLKEAREATARACSTGLPGYCREAAGFYKEIKDIQTLKAQCLSGDLARCFIYAYVTKDKTEAKKYFINVCKHSFPIKSEEYKQYSCNEASELIQVPPDVESYVVEEQACQHWSGEPAYDDERAEDIRKGVEENCKDRSSQLEQLKKKYKSNDEIMLKLKYIPL